MKLQKNTHSSLGIRNIMEIDERGENDQEYLKKEAVKNVSKRKN